MNEAYDRTIMTTPMSQREREIFEAILEERRYQERARPNTPPRSIMEEIATAEEILSRARFVAFQLPRGDTRAARRVLVKVLASLVRALADDPDSVPTRDEEHTFGHIYKGLLARMVQEGQEGQ